MSQPIRFIPSERIESYCLASYPGQISISGIKKNGQGMVRLRVEEYSFDFTNTDDVYSFISDILNVAAVLQRK